MKQILFITALFSCCTTLASTVLAHPPTEAEILALESSGEMLPPPDLVAEIEADLTLIRGTFEFLARIEARPPWEPGGLLMGLTSDAYDAFRAGEHAELEALNAAYGTVDIRWYDTVDICYLRFELHYNPWYLIPDYEAIEGVLHAEPNGIIGDGPDITREGVGLYLFRYAWGDCPAGCIEEHFWRVRIVDGAPVIQEEWGDQLPSWVPVGESSLGRLKSAFRVAR